MAGNNIYNDDLAAKLESTDIADLAAYTLMEKIQPPADENYIICGKQQPKRIRVVSELSIFGGVIW